MRVLGIIDDQAVIVPTHAADEVSRDAPDACALELHDGAASFGWFGHALLLGSARSVLADLTALQHQIAVGLDVDLGRALDRNVLAADHDVAVLLHRDRGVAGLDRDLVAGVDHQLLADVDRGVAARAQRLVAAHALTAVAADADRVGRADRQRAHAADALRLRGADVDHARGADVDRFGHGDVERASAADVDGLGGTDVLCAAAADGDGLVRPDALGAVRADRDRLVRTNRDRLIGADALGAVCADRDRLIRRHLLGAARADRDRFVGAYGFSACGADRHALGAAHALAAVRADRTALVVLDVDLQIFLGLDEDLLAALLVLEADLVEVVGIAALAAAALPAALGRVRGQVVRRHLVAVVDAAGDDRSIRIALQELDHHFLPDARDMDAAEAAPRPVLRDAHPARAFLVRLAFAVPVELHLHAAVLVGPDLLAGLADHDRGLRPGDDRLGRDARRAKRRLAVDRAERRTERSVRNRQAAFEIVRLDLVRARRDQILLVLVFHRKPAELEQSARAEAACVAAALRLFALRLQLLEPDVHIRFAVRFLRVLARIVVHLEVGVGGGRAELRLQARLRPLEVEVVEHVAPGLDLLGHAPAVDVIALAPLAPLRRVIRHLGITRRRGVRAERIGEHHRVLTVLVLEEVVDAGLFQQTADEVERRLAVLHDVIPRRVARGQGFVEIGEAVAAKHLLHHVGHAHVLEDATVGRAREQPQPRPHRRAVHSVAARGGGTRKAADVAVEMPLLIAALLDVDRDALAEHVAHGHGRVEAQQLELVVEQAPELFAAGHATQLELVALRSGHLRDVAERHAACSVESAPPSARDVTLVEDCAARCVDHHARHGAEAAARVRVDFPALRQAGVGLQPHRACRLDPGPAALHGERLGARDRFLLGHCFSSPVSLTNTVNCAPPTVSVPIAVPSDLSAESVTYPLLIGNRIPVNTPESPCARSCA